MGGLRQDLPALLLPGSRGACWVDSKGLSPDCQVLMGKTAGHFLLSLSSLVEVCEETKYTHILGKE